MSVIPNVTLALRERDAQDPSQFVWAHRSTHDIFGGRRVVVFAVPGAFTPACSSTHLPDYEKAYADICSCGIEDVYCLSVNDPFVMFQWAKSLDVSQVKMLPDGNGDFTRLMGMLVRRERTGMGVRSWRYAMVVNDCNIEVMLAEPDLQDDPAGVPVSASSAQSMLTYLRSQ